jgi:hypothetical protein
VWIVNKCLKGDLLKNRTVLLVVCALRSDARSVLSPPQTHNVALTKPVAEYVVALGADGRIISQGAPDILADTLTPEIRHEQEAIELEDDLDEESEAKKASAKGSKLIVAEEIQEGHVSLKAAKLLLVNLSSWPVLFWVGYLSGMFCVDAAMRGLTYHRMPVSFSVILYDHY